MANLRPKIVKLAKMVGGVAGAMNRIDEKAPEYYALNAVVTDDMADVALVMGLRQPRTFEYIVEKCGRSREETKKLLDQLTYTGVVKVWTDKKDKKDRYFINIFAPGMLETIHSVCLTVPAASPERCLARAADIWKRISVSRWEPEQNIISGQEEAVR